MKGKHLFFDLDRTLWDFEKNSENALRILFKELGLSNHIPNFQEFHKAYKKVNAHLWKEYGKGSITKEFLRDNRFNTTLGKFKIKDVELAQKMSDGYIEISPKQKQLFPSTVETLQKLKQQNYTLHIITNGFKEVQYIKLAHSKLDSFFDVILCSEEVGHNKPSPLIFNFALRQSGARAEDSAMIGDDYRVDVLGAMNVGMAGILFDPCNESKVPKDEWKITSIRELEGILPFVFRGR